MRWRASPAVDNRIASGGSATALSARVMAVTSANWLFVPGGWAPCRSAPRRFVCDRCVCGRSAPRRSTPRLTRSNSTTSGRRAALPASAAGPSAASPTTMRSGSHSRAQRRASRALGDTATIRTRYRSKVEGPGLTGPGAMGLRGRSITSLAYAAHPRLPPAGGGVFDQTAVGCADRRKSPPAPYFRPGAPSVIPGRRDRA